MRRTIKKDILAVLSPDEKGKLRTMLNSPLYQKALSIAENFKPSCNCANAGSGSRDAFSDGRASVRLGEIRGWEQKEVALFALVSTPTEIKEMIEENFPDSGLLAHDDRPVPKAKLPQPART